MRARGRILARGRDRARLLHNLTSNEVKKMTPGAGGYAFLLSPQGRIQADLHLFCFADHFLIDTEPELREKVAPAHPALHHRRPGGTRRCHRATACIGLEGPAAAAILAQMGAPVPDDYAIRVGRAHRRRHYVDRPAGLTHLLRRDATRRSSRLEAAGAQPRSADDARMVRIENGKPRYGEDIRETSLPQETQQMHAVSFTKGCYLGQEIVERIRAQGHVNKKLVRLEIDTASRPRPEPSSSPTRPKLVKSPRPSIRPQRAR